MALLIAEIFRMDQNKQIRLYADLMEEVKLRVTCIDNAANGRTGLPTPIVREFCYLQLRMLCELVAIACLVAHGDITLVQPHKIGKTTAAQDILNELSKLRPHFYPMAATQTVGNSFRIDIIFDKSPLPKEELILLYGKCHRHLHRGSLKGLLNADSALDLNISVPEIIEWTQKINDLLSFHIIAINSDRLFGCMLRNMSDGGKVQVFVADALAVNI
ncbi:MAG: hypothetical protein WAN43_09655 [Rhodomicrobium sp.]